MENELNMRFDFTFKTIEESESFKEFIKEYPEAELCAGFFIIDFISNDFKRSLDYKLDHQVYTFSLNEFNEVKMKKDQLLDIQDVPPLKKIEANTKIEVDELKSIVGSKALDEGISAKFNKIIAVLQVYGEKQIWNLTCMLDGLIILHIIIDYQTGEIIKFERKSMMDFIRKR